MKVVVALITIACCIGCTHLTSSVGRYDGCCGLSQAQWKQYEEKAVAAIKSPTAWAKVGSKMPEGMHPVVSSEPEGTTDSHDGAPPTHLSIFVGTGFFGTVPAGSSQVIVEFSHPDGKILAMHLGDVYWN